MAYSWKSGILGGVSVAENATAGTPLATLVAQDGGVVDAFYYTLTGGDSSLFNIDLYGRLSLKQAIDYDTTGGTSWWRTADGQWHSPDHRYTVVVNAFNDANQIQTTTTFILTMGNVNDNPTNFAWAQQPIGVNQWRNAADGHVTVNINENNAVGMAVGQFAATDGDLVAVNYSLSGADAGHFSINSNGALTLKASLNYEDSVHTAKNYSVVVTATSTDGSAAISSLFVLSLNNLDDNATAWNVTPAAGAAVNETLNITKTVVRPTIESLADFRAVDADGQTVKYGLAGVDSWMFSVDSNGVLYRTRNVDHETNQHQFSVTVWAWGAANTGGIARDGAGISKLFILTINNVDEFTTGFAWAEQPIGVKQWRNGASGLITVNVNENNAVGMAVGQYSAIDGDQVAVNYSLSGADAGNFSINSNGTLTLKSSLNYEDSVHTAKNYSVVVTATSADGSPAVSSLFVVSLQDNTKEFGWTNNPSGIAIAETAALVGTRVADFNIAAVDNGSAFIEGLNSSYSLMSGDTWAFSINKQTGALMLSQPRDYESEHSWRPDHKFSVVVGAWRDGGGAITQLFVLTINSVNESATGFTWAQQPIGANQWRNGADGIVTANVNENNAVGMAVGQFAATDGDQGVVAYSLGGADAPYFSIDTNGRLYLKHTLNYEDTDHPLKNYSVVVVAGSTDGGPAVSSLFVLSLNNLDDNATAWNVTPVAGAAVSETTGITRTVVLSTRESLADFRAVDADGQTVKYGLAGDTAGMFSIDSNGVLYRTRNVDHETNQHQFSVTVWAWGAANTGGIAKDGAGISKLFILTINNVDEFTTGFVWAQQPIGANQWRNGASGPITVNVNENNAVGMAVGQFAATDGDLVAVNYSLSGADAGNFTINSNGALTLKSSLNYEDNTHVGTNYSVVVTATSIDGSAAISSLFVLSLNNLDDNATAWNVTPAAGAAVNETLNITKTVVRPTIESLADFRAVDADGQTVKYGLAGDTAGMFSIDSNGVLYRTRNVDYETNQHQFSVTVWAWGAANSGGIARDGAGISKLFILTINNVDEFTAGFAWAEQPIGVKQWRNGASGPITVNVNENNAVGMAVGQFAATDGDQGVVTYSLGGADAGYFSINNNGTLSLKSRLDYEDSVHTAKNYSVVVTAKSTDASVAASSLFVVSLQDNTKEFVWTSNPSGIAISETAAVAGVAVADFNIGGGTVGSAFTEGAGSGYWLVERFGDVAQFNINQQTGVLTLRNARDYETDHAWRPDHKFSVAVGAWRDGGGAVSQVFVLTVADVNEATAFQWQLQPFWSPNSTGSGWNNWNGASSTIFLSLGENITSAGLQVAKFKGLDPDIGARVTYDVGGADATYFSIDSNGRLYLAANLDYESAHVGKNYSVVVVAKSTDGSPAISNLMVISLGNLDDNATAWNATPAPGIAVDETLNITRTVVRASRESLADFRAVDADGQTVKYGLAGDTAGMFSIDSNGVLYRTRNVDYETNQHQFSVTVWAWGAANSGGIARDGAGISKLFILTINNVNEFTAGFAWAEQPIGVKQWRNGASGPITVNVNENNAVGMAVGQFAATDGDQVAVTYNLGGIDAAYFSINNNGTLSLKSRLDYEDSVHTAKNYSVVVMAKSTDASAAVSSLFLLSLNNLDDNATAWSGSPATGIAVNETAGMVGTRLLTTAVSVANFAATDIDGQFVNYTLDGADKLLFSIDGNGVLYRKHEFDYETFTKSRPSHQFSVVVVAWGTSGNGITKDGQRVSRLFIMTINNTGEYSADFASAPTAATMTEGNATIGREVAKYLATDGDSVPVTYSLSGGDAGYFTIDDSGSLKLKSALDFEDSTHPVDNYSVVVTAKSTDDSPAFSRLFVLSITNIDDNPTTWNTTPITGVGVDEKASLATASSLATSTISLANFGAMDIDGQIVTYSLDGVDKSLFSLDSNGVLYRKFDFDYETTASARPSHLYSVVVRAWGAPGNGITTNGPGISQLFVMTVNNINEFTTDFASRPLSFAISENNGVGVQVAKYLATDGDLVPVSYSLSGGDASYFNIDNIGSLTLLSTLDFEDATRLTHRYTVTVTAKSADASPAVSSLFILSVGNIDDNPTMWKGNPISSRLVNETANAVNNAAAATAVSLADFAATDIDGQTINYWLAGTDSNLFSIDSNGVLYRKVDFDYDISTGGRATHLYSVVVGAWGAPGNGVTTNGAGISQLLILQINDVNDAPSWTTTPTNVIILPEKEEGLQYNYTRPFTLPASSWDVNQNYDAVPNDIRNYADGKVVVMPFDLTVNLATYVPSSLLSSGRFYYRLAGDNSVHETPAGQDFTFTKGMKLTAFQSGVIVPNLGFSQITGGDAVAPLNAPGRFNIPGGNIVATFAAIDPEGTSAISYTIVGADADQFFMTNTDGVIAIAQSLDYEARGVGLNYTLVLKASDGTLSVTKSVILSLVNTNDEFSWSGTQVAGISLSETTGTPVAGVKTLATFTAFDSDFNGGGYTPHSGAGFVSYVLDGTTADSKYFTINKDTGVLSFISAVDADNGHAAGYSIVVWANEIQQRLGSPWISQVFLLTIGDINEAPTWTTTPSTVLTVNENDASTYDYNAPFTLPMSGWNSASWTLGTYADGKVVFVPFDLDVGRVGGEIDTNPFFSKFVYQQLGDSSPTTIGNGHAPFHLTRGMKLIGFTQISRIPGWGGYGAVGEDIVVPLNDDRRRNLSGAILTTFTAVDPENRLQYSVSGTDASNFIIGDDGALIFLKGLDAEDKNGINYSVTVVASDGTFSVTKLFVLSIANTNDEEAAWASVSTSRTISENNVAGVSIANFLATDADGVGISYWLTGADANFFSMDSNGGLHIKGSLDYEDDNHSDHTFSVVVNAIGTAGGAGVGAGATAISSEFVLAIADIAGASHAAHSVYIDGTTALHAVNVGGIIGHDDAGNIDYANVQFHGVNYTDKVITRNVEPDGLQLTTVNYVVRGISDLESLRLSFNGFTDTDGSKRNHWFFVQDDATDHSGHIVFDADGQNVNLHALNDGGGLATSDQINLLAGSNYGIDGDFTKPTDLNLNLASDPLHQNIAGALTFDQFLALLGGNNHISFV